MELPKAPTIFGKYRNALVPDGAKVTLPAASSKCDYEAEVAFVIGRRARGQRRRCARPYRRLHPSQRPSARDPGPDHAVDGRQGLRRLGSCGPAPVTPDEAGPHDGIGIRMLVNGEGSARARTPPT